MKPLIIKLNQHTPLIHFQHDQEGATLRASEVKPKLDRFIIKNLGGKKNINEKWFNNIEKESLNYKLIFNATGNNEMVLNVKGPIKKGGKYIYETSPFPMVLSNMGGKETKEELKNFSFHKEVDGEIKSFNKELLSAINSCLGDFFLLHNFGNRQNKGFGSFTLVQKTNPDELKIIKQYKGQVWFWDYEITQPIKTVFSDISIVYSLLKTGINFPDHPLVPQFDRDGKPLMKNGEHIKRPDQTRKGKYQFYEKSFLYKYVADNFEYGNEKKFIKEKFFNPSKRVPYDGVEKKFVRALLGVALFNEFRDIKRNGKIDFKSEEVDRFSSPITFKILDNRVCFFIEDLTEAQKIGNKTFLFKDAAYNQTEKIETPANFGADKLLGLLDSFQEHFNKLIFTVRDELFEMYKTEYDDMPLTVRNIIDVLRYIKIKSL